MPKSREPAPIVIDTTTATLGLAALTVAAALVVGFVAGVSAALLAVVTGALLGAILLVWHSLRTLAGDAEVDVALDAATLHGPSELSERKRRALRALKDLEQDHALGKIDDADYAALDDEYRTQAKEVLREMDEEIAPFREKAEAMVRAHLDKRPSEAAPVHDASTCAACETKNDADATFCKKCGAELGQGEEADT
jgi:hypothetical protein